MDIPRELAKKTKPAAAARPEMQLLLSSSNSIGNKPLVPLASTAPSASNAVVSADGLPAAVRRQVEHLKQRMQVLGPLPVADPATPVAAPVKKPRAPAKPRKKPVPTVAAPLLPVIAPAPAPPPTVATAPTRRVARVLVYDEASEESPAGKEDADDDNEEEDDEDEDDDDEEEEDEDDDDDDMSLDVEHEAKRILDEEEEDDANDSDFSSEELVDSAESGDDDDDDPMDVVDDAAAAAGTKTPSPVLTDNDFDALSKVLANSMSSKQQAARLVAGPASSLVIPSDHEDSVSSNNNNNNKSEQEAVSDTMSSVLQRYGISATLSTALDKELLGATLTMVEHVATVLVSTPMAPIASIPAADAVGKRHMPILIARAKKDKALAGALQTMQTVFAPVTELIRAEWQRQANSAKV